jgi:Protein of unknown function (DUF2950)
MRTPSIDVVKSRKSPERRHPRRRYVDSAVACGSRPWSQHPPVDCAGRLERLSQGETGTGSAGGQPVLIQGYYFRVAAKHPNSDFAFIAYPADYRSSGVKTFIVTDKDVVNEKDLGTNTTAQASTMPADFKGGWDAADEK